MRSPQNLLQCLWHATKIPSSSFWHLLYDNNQWKISNWSEIISWCIFAQSRLYAFLKKQFPEITTIACRTIIPCVCVLKVCIELYLLPSSPRLLYFRCMTTLVCLDAFSHTYRNINISNLVQCSPLKHAAIVIEQRLCKKLNQNPAGCAMFRVVYCLRSSA